MIIQSYLNPYSKALAQALTLQQRVGIIPQIGVNPLESKNIIQILMITYGVQAKNHTTNRRPTILARVISIAIYNKIWSFQFYITSILLALIFPR